MDPTKDKLAMFTRYRLKLSFGDKHVLASLMKYLDLKYKKIA
jgi:hypothetical protein